MTMTMLVGLNRSRTVTKDASSHALFCRVRAGYVVIMHTSRCTGSRVPTTEGTGPRGVWGWGVLVIRQETKTSKQ